MPRLGYPVTPRLREYPMPLLHIRKTAGRPSFRPITCHFLANEVLEGPLHGRKTSTAPDQ